MKSRKQKLIVSNFSVSFKEGGNYPSFDELYKSQDSSYEARYLIISQKAGEEKVDLKHLVNLINKNKSLLYGVSSVDFVNFSESFNFAKKAFKKGGFVGIKVHLSESNLKWSSLGQMARFCQKHLIPLVVSVGKEGEGILDKFSDFIAKYENLLLYLVDYEEKDMPWLANILKNKNRYIYLEFLDNKKGDTLLEWARTNKLLLDRYIFNADMANFRLNNLMEKFKNYGLSKSDFDKVVYGNAKNFFKLTKEYKIENYREKLNNVWLAVTFQCNRNCYHCFEKKRIKEKAFMSFDSFLKILAKAKKEKVERLTIFGGEPTLWPYLKEAILLIRKAGIQSEIYTNGVNSIKEFLPDRVHVNLNTCTTKVAKELERCSTDKMVLVGEYVINRHTTEQDIKRTLKNSNMYKGIAVALDATEKKKEIIINLFDKILPYKDYPNVSLNLHMPSCCLTERQNIIARTTPNIFESNCFPGWEDVVVDLNLNIKSCIGVKHSKKLNMNIPFIKYREVLYKETSNEISDLPFLKCKQCFSYNSKVCTGGCQMWKEGVVR